MLRHIRSTLTLLLLVCVLLWAAAETLRPLIIPLVILLILAAIANAFLSGRWT